MDYSIVFYDNLDTTTLILYNYATWHISISLVDRHVFADRHEIRCAPNKRTREFTFRFAACLSATRAVRRILIRCGVGEAPSHHARPYNLASLRAHARTIMALAITRDMISAFLQRARAAVTHVRNVARNSRRTRERAWISKCG